MRTIGQKLLKQPFALAAAMALIIPALSMACGGSGAPADSEAIVTSAFVYSGDVYVAGVIKHIPNYKPGEAPPPGTIDVYKAVFWKNGKINYLTEGYQGYTYANSIFVDGTGVYVGGTNEAKAGYWKDGSFQQIPGVNYGAVGSVAVQGGDVYLLGDEHGDNFPIYPITSRLWKNGEAQQLEGGFSLGGDRLSPDGALHVSGGDVLVAGHSYLDEGRMAVWKNGAKQTLGGGGVPIVSSVFAAGGDVYVAGAIRRENQTWKAALWKNGAMQTLSNDYSYAESVFVSGGDVYVAGRQGFLEYDSKNMQQYLSHTQAVLWKNGAMQNLAGKGSVANSVFVEGGNVYVAGNIGGNAVVWKNGAMQKLEAK
jgi:hypothetical protein